MSPESGKRWPLWARALVGVFAAIGAYYVAMLALISTGCFVTDLAVVPSASGAWVAKITERQCRLETPTTQITVNREIAGRAEAEVVFEAVEKAGENGRYAKIPLRVAWADGDELQVYYPYALAFHHRVDDAMGARVRYHEVSPDSD